MNYPRVNFVPFVITAQGYLGKDARDFVTKILVDAEDPGQCRKWWRRDLSQSMAFYSGAMVMTGVGAAKRISDCDLWAANSSFCTPNMSNLFWAHV